MNKFYTFSQNNSGGSFTTDLDRGIGEYVIIEAESAEDANSRAEAIGIYFNGIVDGIDCECCGNRWFRADDGAGYLAPSIYGEAIVGDTVLSTWSFRSDIFIHRMDGTVTHVKIQKKE